MVHTSTGSMIYVEDAHTGEFQRCDSSLLPMALEAMRRHMVLDDLAGLSAV